MADELRIDGKPIRLPVALRFLPLIAVERPDEFDAWALRWLARWAAESRDTTIAAAAEVAACLADIPAEPASAIAAIEDQLRAGLV